MTLEEIETILFEEIYENYGVHGQMHAAKLILASHLRSQICRIEMTNKVFENCKNDSDGNFYIGIDLCCNHNYRLIEELQAELTKLNQ